jgi:hypothetical protein
MKGAKMPRAAIPDEVQVVRFFETGPAEKVEAVFNIVAEKMRERRAGGRAGDEPPAGTRPARTVRRKTSDAGENQAEQS